MNRRRLLLGSAAGVAVGAVGAAGGLRAWQHFSQPEARVGVYRTPSYEGLVEHLVHALQDFPGALAQARGGSVVLKPNMVEVAEDHPINTDARLLAALVVAFREHGAREVLVAEGPGHHRDMEMILAFTGLDALLQDVGARFVDLNVDVTSPVSLPQDVTGLGSLHLPRTVLECDLLVSVAKMKTHHWVGATLTMKNLFGCVPGARYGWPKNVLHWAGIDRSIIDLWTTLRPGLGVVDGIVAMEGDGPIMGTEKPMGIVVMGEQLPAVDATTARLMGFLPERFSYLQVASRLGGTMARGRIETIGDEVEPDRFEVLDKFRSWQA